MRRTAREHAPSILVAALSAAFGVALLQGTGALALMIRADDTLGSSTAAGIALASVAIVFIAIATYVAAIVTANTFATIIAGRVRTIALLRLLGATAVSQRRSVAREGFVVGCLGSLLGASAGTAITALGLAVAALAGWIPSLAYSFVDPVLLVPIVAVILTTWIASWVGARRVLVVSPLEALGAAQERSAEQVGSRRARNATALVLVILGFGLLGLGILAGLVSQAGVLIGMVGGMVSFTGVVLGAHAIMPWTLRSIGRVFGGSASARLAAANAVRYPERSTRTTIGIVIGVTLVTMFGVAGGSFQSLFDRLLSGEDDAAQISLTIAAVVGIFSVLVGFSALIAAVGLVNTLSLGIMQRTRELGLLRALGFTVRQLRAMVIAESGQLVAAAIVVGLLLGGFYGWAGAQSMLALVTGFPAFVVPVVSPVLLAVVVGGAVLLTIAASVVPTRRATSVSPVTALAVE